MEEDEDEDDDESQESKKQKGKDKRQVSELVFALEKNLNGAQTCHFPWQQRSLPTVFCDFCRKQSKKDKKNKKAKHKKGHDKKDKKTAGIGHWGGYMWL